MNDLEITNEYYGNQFIKFLSNRGFINKFNLNTTNNPNDKKEYVFEKDGYFAKLTLKQRKHDEKTLYSYIFYPTYEVKTPSNGSFLWGGENSSELIPFQNMTEDEFSEESIFGILAIELKRHNL